MLQNVVCRDAAGRLGATVHASFAAIAYSPSTGKWAYTSGCQDLATAQNNALDRVGTIDARLAIWVENGYAALAKTAAGRYAWAWSATSRADAEQRAKNFLGEDAAIVCWVYSGT